MKENLISCITYNAGLCQRECNDAHTHAHTRTHTHTHTHTHTFFVVFVSFGVELAIPAESVRAGLSPVHPALPKLSEPKGSANGSLEGGVLLSSWLLPPPPNGSLEAFPPLEGGTPNGSPPATGPCIERDQCIVNKAAEVLG